MSELQIELPPKILSAFRKLQAAATAVSGTPEQRQQVGMIESQIIDLLASAVPAVKNENGEEIPRQSVRIAIRKALRSQEPEPVKSPGISRDTSPRRAAEIAEDALSLMKALGKNIRDSQPNLTEAQGIAKAMLTETGAQIYRLYAAAQQLQREER